MVRDFSGNSPGKMSGNSPGPKFLPFKGKAGIVREPTGIGTISRKIPDIPGLPWYFRTIPDNPRQVSGHPWKSRTFPEIYSPGQSQTTIRASLNIPDNPRKSPRPPENPGQSWTSVWALMNISRPIKENYPLGLLEYFRYILKIPDNAGYFNEIQDRSLEVPDLIKYSLK